MAIKKELVQFTIVNDTDCAFNIPLMQQNAYSINATTKYSWNITSATISCGTGTILINDVLTTITFTPDLAGLLAALNALGFGFFCTETIGGQTFLYVTDDKNIYGGLDLCPSGTTTTTTTSTTTAAPTTTTTTTTSTTTAAPETTTTTTTTSTTTAAPLAVSSMLYSIQQINVTECQVQADITLNGNVSQNTDFDFQYQLNSTGSTLYFGTVTVLAGQNTGTALVGGASSALCTDGVNSGCINTVTGDSVSIVGFSC